MTPERPCLPTDSTGDNPIEHLWHNIIGWAALFATWLAQDRDSAVAFRQPLLAPAR